MNRWAHIIFWLIISTLLVILFGTTSGNFIYAIYFLFFFLPVVILTAWVFNDILISNYLLKSRYGKFLLFSFYTLVISLDIEMILVFLAFLLMSLYDYQNLSAIIDSYKWMPVVMYFIVLLYGFTMILSRLIKQSRETTQLDDHHITVRSERKNRQISVEVIRYIESMSDYVKIFLNSGEIVITREKISALQLKLPDQFIRIHRSFIVNRIFIDSYNREEIVAGKNHLPLSRTYKKEFIQTMEKP